MSWKQTSGASGVAQAIAASPPRHLHEVLHREPVEARPGQHVRVGVDDRRRRLVAEGRLLGGEGKGEVDGLLVVGLLSWSKWLMMSIRLMSSQTSDRRW